MSKNQRKYLLMQKIFATFATLLQTVLWCNGSTTGFGSVCPGSNPGKTTENLRLV